MTCILSLFDDFPTTEEFSKAILIGPLARDKAPGKDGIPPEVTEVSMGTTLLQQLHVSLSVLRRRLSGAAYARYQHHGPQVILFHHFYLFFPWKFLPAISDKTIIFTV